MKIFRGPPSALLLGAVLVSTVLGKSLRLRSSHAIVEDGDSKPSCKVFTEMLQRIYYMRTRLEVVTDSLSTIGYKPGHEWEVEHGIGTVNRSNLEQKLCSLFAGPPSKKPHTDPVSLLGSRERPKESKIDEANASSKGCPEESPQLHLIKSVLKEFDGTNAEGKKLGAIQAIFESLLKSVEESAMNLFNFRECVAQGGEFKTRQVCKLHREEQSNTLKMLQRDLPDMRARVHSLKSRSRDIKRGVSKECYLEKDPKLEPLSDRKAGFCLNITTMTDALLDGRKTQQDWLEKLGDDVQRLGVMSMQLGNRINDPVLKQDKIPLGALKALKASWEHLAGPMQIMRLMASVRAEHAGSIDGSLLGLSGLLKNVSTENDCLSEAFRLRYSAQSCKSLKTQLDMTLHERQTDLAVLQQTVDKALMSTGEGLKNCTDATPTTEGCWFRLPSGCPKIKKWVGADKWTRDVFGEEATGSGQDSTVCKTSRKMQLDLLCGVENTQMHFVLGMPVLDED